MPRPGSRPRSTSPSPIRAAAPAQAPAMLPSPPRTTMHKIRNDSQNLNISGERNCDQRAKNAPAKAPIPAEKAKATVLQRWASTPVEAAASSSSRMASQARPSLEALTRRITMQTRAVMARAR